MTPKQRETLDFISGFIEDKGYSPSMSEIADAMDLKSKSGVLRIVQALHEQGKILYRRGRARSIELENDRTRGIAGVRALIEHYDAGTFTAEETIESIRSRIGLSDARP